jgi:thymidylate synthase (FAD)
MQIIKHPTVTLIARPQFVEPEHLRVQWKGDSTDGERVAEYAGRLCYMSQRNPAARSDRGIPAEHPAAGARLGLRALRSM